MDSSGSPPDPLRDLVDTLGQALAALPLLAAAPAPPSPAATSASTASSAPVCVSPMAQPAPYSGSAEDCNGFLLQCSLVLEMQPHLYSTERPKVAFIIAQLRGQALLWAESLWSQKSPVTQSYASFVDHFKEVFGKPSGDSSVGEELCRLQQGKLTAPGIRAPVPDSSRQERLERTSSPRRVSSGAETPVVALLDSGSAGNFISGTLCRQLGLRTEATTTPYQVRSITGKPLGRRQVSHSAGPVRLQIGALHVEETTLWFWKSPQLTSYGGVRGWSSTTQSSLGAPGSDVFSPKRASKLPPHRPWDCAIDLLPGEPVPREGSIPCPSQKRRPWRSTLKEALEQGYIRPSTSPAASSFFFVAKKDGGLRPCIDYRALNRITVKFRYPFPLVPAALEHLRGATLFTKLDLRSAYNLIRNVRGTSGRPPSLHPPGHYEYLVMPYGLANAPSVFRDFIHEVFPGVPPQFILTPTNPFILEVDASTTGVGAVLSRSRGTPNRLHPCAFFSRKLNPAERNYDIGNRELLAVKLALEEWRHWVGGAKHPFTVLTDHKNLEYLRAAKRLNPRQARWALFFTRFNCTISYRPGSKNTKADALSRMFAPEESPETPEPILPEKPLCQPHHLGRRDPSTYQYLHLHSAGLPTGISIHPQSTTHRPDSLCSHVTRHWSPWYPRNSLAAEGTLLVAQHDSG
ncbi:hypothetical protein QTP86_003987 [Hemibagrus guttatus]|nr:hypothetical protein QTP86_003987 [Hemibagrus guttatus]